MRDVTDEAAAHLALVRAALSAIPPGTKALICLLPVWRNGPVLWDLWAPGECSCGEPSHPDRSLDAAAAQLHAWRSATPPRPRATTGEAA